MDIAESVTYDFARNRSFSPDISYPLGGKPSSPFEANKLECIQEAFPKSTIWIDAYIA